MNAARNRAACLCAAALSANLAAAILAFASGAFAAASIPPSGAFDNVKPAGD